LAQAVCNGIQISYEDTEPGSSKTPVVLIHGHGLNRSMWDQQKQALRGSRRVVTVDLRGHGRSEKPKTGYAREAEVADLKALFDIIRVRKIHLVGLSRGAGVALAFAAAHPGMVESVVALGAGHDYARHMPDFADQRLQTMATLRAEGLRAAKDYWSALPIFAPANEDEDLALRLDDILITYTGAHWLDPDPPHDPSLADIAGTIQARTLLVVGERDLPGFHACADELTEKIPGARKKVIPGAGHLLGLEAAEAVTATIEEFLSAA